MAATTTINISEPDGPAQPAWEVALLLPLLQGQWGESDYPNDEQIIVLRLDGIAYVEHCVAMRGSRATSALIEGFAVDVAETLDAV